jgi:hypothetical protein
MLTNSCARRVLARDPFLSLTLARASDDPSMQICDGIVVSDDSIVLMEYKSSMFRADTKYSGNYAMLGDEIEKKLVHDKEANQRKGVWELSEAVQKLFGTRASITLPEIDLKKIRRVCLYIITLDSIGARIGMSPFLSTFLDERLDRSAFPTVEIRPLFCSDIEALETVTGFFATVSLPRILERWFETNPSLTTPLLAINLDTLPWRENNWLRTEWNAIFKTMVRTLFPDKDPDVVLAEAIRRGQEQR